MLPDLGRWVFWGYSNGGREPVVFSAEGKECPTFGCRECPARHGTVPPQMAEAFASENAEFLSELGPASPGSQHGRPREGRDAWGLGGLLNVCFCHVSRMPNKGQDRVLGPDVSPAARGIRGWLMGLSRLPS